ncbi:glycosyl transferase family 2 [Coriobacterium glomerans PW2]|uniref:Glycosyl transferase family 2 n=1 Tax=Coriobacterium glomerans (strain ATCC 49209 / DSM 20642 / JCM 10262 / PW2) TaxID=700015 RepID=F2N8H7_CORGP|nr:glycosyltransferase family 2 protein [Coriobacterium glomerans]AEB07360.1 glycosyl transferase family 2 [Coriobacterium glomerans PW2]
MHMISVVVPCYNEVESLPIFVTELERVIRSMRDEFGVSFELIFVDDGSQDATLSSIKMNAARLSGISRVRWLSFSRNFGKEAAIFAGLERSSGDFVATIDADLQDPPSLLFDMYSMLQDNEFDNVAARRANRDGEPTIRSLFARSFYRIFNRISNTDVVDGARDFRLMRRSMVDAVLSLRERNRFSKGIFGWVGFKTRWIPYVNARRVAGETKWSFISLVLYSIDGIMAFSTAPLFISSIAGIILCFAAIFGALFIVVKTFLWGEPVAGWPSLACIVTLLGGLQLLCLGIMGQYLAKTYLETKNRPLYIVKESGTEEEDDIADSESSQAE